MWAWLQGNAQVVSAIASALMLCVWLVYLQLLLNRYRHRMRPKILINRSPGDDIGSQCIITNMSAEPLYLETVLVDIGLGKETTRGALVSGADAPGAKGAGWGQGPLASGEMIDIGTFEQMLVQVLRHSFGETPPLARVTSLNVIAAATYTAEERIVAAERAFQLDGRRLVPRSYTSRQIRGWRERRRVERDIIGFYGPYAE